MGFLGCGIRRPGCEDPHRRHGWEDKWGIFLKLGSTFLYGSNFTPPIVNIVALGFVLKVSRSIIAWIMNNYTMEMW